MSEHRPLISVLIPTYNMGHTLGDALDSVLKQEQAGLEVIVSDNHSNDGTSEVLRKYSGYRRLRVVEPVEHVSMYGNFNWAWRFARGEIVKYLCADDILLPGALGTIIKHFQAYPRVGVLQFSGPCLDEAGREVGQYGYNEGIRMGLWSGRRLALAEVPSMDLATPSHTAFRRELLELASAGREGPFDESMIQADWDLLLRLFRRCDVYRVSGQLVGYRVNGYHRQISDTTWALADALRIAERHYGKESGAGGRYGRCRRVIENDVCERFVWWIANRLVRGQIGLAGKALRMLDKHEMVFAALVNAVCRSPLYFWRRLSRG